jgi:predicted naringenin-chalcone synthase
MTQEIIDKAIKLQNDIRRYGIVTRYAATNYLVFHGIFGDGLSRLVLSGKRKKTKRNRTMNKAEKEKYISWGDMSEEEKVEFFKSNPFKIKNYE